MPTALYLAATEVIDHQAPEARRLALELASGETDQTSVTKRRVPLLACLAVESSS